MRWVKAYHEICENISAFLVMDSTTFSINTPSMTPAYALIQLSSLAEECRTTQIQTGYSTGPSTAVHSAILQTRPSENIELQLLPDNHQG